MSLQRVLTRNNILTYISSRKYVKTGCYVTALKSTSMIIKGVNKVVTLLIEMLLYKTITLFTVKKIESYIYYQEVCQRIAEAKIHLHFLKCHSLFLI